MIYNFPYLTRFLLTLCAGKAEVGVHREAVVGAIRLAEMCKQSMVTGETIKLSVTGDLSK